MRCVWLKKLDNSKMASWQGFAFQMSWSQNQEVIQTGVGWRNRSRRCPECVQNVLGFPELIKLVLTVLC